MAVNHQPNGATQVMSFALSILTLLVLVGCSSNNNAPNDSFDRHAMLADMASKLIVPSYAQLDAAIADMQSAANRFTGAPSRASLQELMKQWDTVATRWQRAVSFDFGPAETLYGNLSVNAGTFPADSAGIEAYIAANDTSLQNYERDTRGIYGIEYLLFHDQEDATVQKFLDEPTRCAYLRSVVQRLYSDVHQVYSAWTSGYVDDFVSRNGTDAGSGTSQIFNAMNISFEMIKNYKLGLPLGLRAGQVHAEPTKVEALYSGRSVDLIALHFTAVMNIWEGRTVDGTKILGFKDYLHSVPNGDRLIVDTEQQRDSVYAAISLMPVDIPLSEQVMTMPGPATTLQTEMQKLTRFLKSELSSLTGLAITYASGDGD